MKNTQCYMKSPRTDCLKINMLIYENSTPRKPSSLWHHSTQQLDYVSPTARSSTQPIVRPDSKHRQDKRDQLIKMPASNEKAMTQYQNYFKQHCSQVYSGKAKGMPSATGVLASTKIEKNTVYRQKFNAKLDVMGRARLHNPYRFKPSHHPLTFDLPFLSSTSRLGDPKRAQRSQLLKPSQTVLAQQTLQYPGSFVTNYSKATRPLP